MITHSLGQGKKEDFSGGFYRKILFDLDREDDKKMKSGLCEAALFTKPLMANY